jgi:hypothetical protein
MQSRRISLISGEGCERNGNRGNDIWTCWNVDHGEMIWRDGIKVRLVSLKEGTKKPTFPPPNTAGLNERIRHYNLITPAPFLEKSPVLLSTEITHLLKDMPPRERPQPKKIECW